MKTLIATLALMMALSVPAQAEPASCEQIADLAKSIMTARQKGVSMSKVMELADGSALFESMIVNAYEVHRFKAPVWQEAEVAEFRDKWYMACYKEFKGD